ncbi:hypothetical protein [Oceanisphaera pacifica]|uniref:Uncharacterized protein n=1 Tax=Oceanisphaera pacifica TaxID=2818389 RepID=A0ABS3NIJ8_9GAMM|nr:hypothetical protein [Oceanisphaera pacifica]MBO1520051.1 hypothetical protein [Oceanisphaera pacifica]
MAEKIKFTKAVKPKKIIGLASQIEPKTLAELEAMHTGSLMNRRKALLKCPETSTLPELDKALPTGDIRFKDTAAWRKAYQDLKSVLDTREHLPSKKERKAMRQQRVRSRR